MAKATATRIARMYRATTTRVLPAQPRAERPCRYCHKPMVVSAGQIAYYHAECRKKKRSLRAQGNKR